MEKKTQESKQNNVAAPAPHHHHAVLPEAPSRHRAIVVCDACKGKADAPNDTKGNQGAKYAERRRKAFLLLVRRTPQAEVVAATGFTPRRISDWAGTISETLAAIQSNREVL
jgi:hypothetical protein